MKKRLMAPVYALFAALLVGIAPVTAQNAAVAASPLPLDASVSSGNLANGMRYLVARNSEPANRIYLRLAVNAGSSLEDDDQKGIAHLVEHMAFNGTALFAKNKLIDYFESIGMSFGPEVNAYTSFDETVYMLEIPADDPAILRTSMQVLQDWASAISFDAEELDKERGVVVEEWRLGRGASGRVQDKEIPFLFAGSRYAERLPIGDPEVVKGVPRARVLDFYKKWYRPDLMTVAVVGDADPALLVAEIKATLGTIAAPEARAERPTFPAILQKTPAALVIRDPEIQYTTVQLLEQREAPSFVTTADLREDLAQSIAFAAFNNRLSEKTLVADPLLLGAFAGSQRIARPSAFSYLAMVPATGKFEPALKQLLEEFARLETFGLTEAEMERAKQSILDSMRQTWLNREKIPSSSRASSLVQFALSGEIALSVQDQYDLYNKIVPEITMDEITRAIGDWYTERGTILLVTAPDGAADIPSDAALKSLWLDWKPETALTAYSETGLDRPLFTASGAPGKVVSEETVAAVGVKRWTLSNGARVLVYPTANKANEILFSAWSKGGLSLVSDADYPSAAIATSYAQMSGLNGFSATDLQKKLSGKTVGAGPWLDESWEGLYGSSSVADLETLCELVNLQFTAPNFSDAAWQSLSAQLKTVSESRKNDPSECFSDLKVRLLYGSNVRRSNLTESLVAAMAQAKAEAAYRARFANAGDFTFAFVGSIDEAALRGFVETYIASLPATPAREEAVSLGISFPKGATADTLNMGIDPKSRVFVAFGGKPAIESGDIELFSSLTSLLDIRLREIIREDMSGSYGVSVSGNLTEYPEPNYEIRIEFGCEPSREDELSKAVFEQIRWMQGEPIPESYLTKLRENFRRTQEEGLKNNGWWLGKIVNASMRGRPLDEISDANAVISSITAERLGAMARKYFPADTYVKAYLSPKK